MSEEANIQSLSLSTPRETKKFMVHAIIKGVTPFVQSSPGLGKSSITYEIANEHDLVLIDERLSTRSPVDLSGLPDFIGQGKDRRASFTPFNVYPTEDTEIPKGKAGWLLFLDEFNSAPKTVQAAAYKLILDRMVGLHRLHPNVVIACAGNLSTDRAIVNPMSTAMQSRLVHIEMTHSHKEWLEDVALKHGYDERIIAYLNYMPGRLMDFRPDHNEKTFCCPRTWEFMNRLVNGVSNAGLGEFTKLFGGTITSGVATDFVAFTEVYKNMISFKMILSDPSGAPIPADLMTRWAVISHIMEKVTKETFADTCTYINRFTTDFKVLFYRSILVRHPSLRSNPDFIKAMSEMSRYFHGSPYAQAA